MNIRTILEQSFCDVITFPLSLFSFHQAAIGSISLDTARDRGFVGERQEELGIQVSGIGLLWTELNNALRMSVT